MKIRTGSGVVLILFGCVLAGTAANWLITPITHPDASTVRTVAVGVQLLLGIALVVWGARLDKQDRRVLGDRYRIVALAMFWMLFGAWLAGAGVHWFISRQVPASTLRIVAVWGQVAAGIVLAVMASRRYTATVAPQES